MSKHKFSYIRNGLSSFDSSTVDEEKFFEEVERLKVKKWNHLKGKKVAPNHEEALKQTIYIMPFNKDIESLSAESQLKYDRRSGLQYFVDTLNTNHPFLYAFKYKIITHLVIYRVFLLMTEINLGIALNAAYIEDKIVES